MIQKTFLLVVTLGLPALAVFAQETAVSHGTSPAVGAVVAADNASTKTEGRMKRKKEAALEIKNTKCPVTGEKIGGMGQVAYVTHNGKRVALCCKACKGKFVSDADKYTKVAEEYAAANATAFMTE